MYKAAYGDLKVPSRFIVPSLPPWPEKAWGMKLGIKVSAIRATGKHIQNNEKRRKLLDGLGFLWRLRTTASAEEEMDGVTFDQIYEALLTYRKEHPTGSTLHIPPNFIVPDCDPWPQSTRGLPLGKTIVSMRSKSFLKANPGAEQKLINLGLELETKSATSDSRFDIVFDALKRYKEIFGDLLVPQPFFVPEDSPEWPERTWGLRLGARVNAIRSQGTFVNTNPERRQDLDSIGFIWSPPPSDRAGKRGRKTNAEEAADAEQTANMPAADSFAIEDDNEYDWETTESAMENIFGPSFDFGSNDPFKNDNGTPSWGIVGESMASLSRTTPTEVPPPTEVEYVPPQTLEESLAIARSRAISVGIILDTGDDISLMKKGKQKKDVPWFNDDFGDNFVFEDVVEALTVYKEMYGDFSNLTVQGSDFMVPAPETSLFGEEDSSLFDSEASARAAAAIAAFEEAGSLSDSEDLIAFEIQRLQQEVQSQVAVQNRVAVATMAKPMTVGTSVWPEHLSGMPLGGIVKRIRDGSLEVKHIPERKKMLDKIGFDWGDARYFLEIPFEKAMCAFYAYYLVRGDLFVNDDFVMPDEDPWPEALAGYEIGKSVKRIRELQNFLDAYHPEKVILLRALDFVWFPTLALPLDPDEADLTPELQFLIRYGHPDIYQMVPLPEEAMAKLQADGPFFKTDDPKEKWREYYNYEYVKDLWYDNGFRDTPYRLRNSGFPMLAAEHEEKYGPGLYEQIDICFKELQGYTSEGSMSGDLKSEFSKKLEFFRCELVGSKDFTRDELKALIQKVDNAMMFLMKVGVVNPENLNEFVDSGFGAGIEGVIDEYEEQVKSEQANQRNGFGDLDDEDVEDELGFDDDEYEDD